jgi:transposase
MSFLVARWLVRLGLEPVVVDAREVRLKAHRPNQKSDRRDAVELCEGLRRGMYRSIIHVPPREVQQLRGLLSRRRHFVRMKTRETNAAKYLLRAEGLGHLAGCLDTDGAWGELEERLEFAPDLQGLVRCHRVSWQGASANQDWVEGELDGLQRTRFDEPVLRLQQMPGVGPIVAQTVVAVLSDVHRFPSAKHVASYAGLVPCTYQSGETDYQGHITKKGSPELRAMLCEAAHHAARSDHPMNPFFAKVCSRHGYKAAIVAVAHRLLRVMWAMLRSGEDLDVKKLGVEEGPYERVIRKRFRLKSRRVNQAPRAEAAAN